MKESFTFAIRNDRYKYITALQFFILFINAVCFTWFGYNSSNYFFYIIAVLTLIHLLLYIRNQHSDSPAVKYIPFSASVLCIIAWINLYQYLFAAAMLLIILLQVLVKKKYLITIDTDGAGINSFPVKNFKWSEIQNLILKDGLLTIDCRNNKIIQSEIMADESDADDENEFNEFCRKQLPAIKK